MQHHLEKVLNWVVHASGNFKVPFANLAPMPLGPGPKGKCEEFSKSTVRGGEKTKKYCFKGQKKRYTYWEFDPTTGVKGL